ncbi:unnamed protein product [Closterium sp. NIES-65]|nr:unnamed protein product [Closterium sp. NIES-65]
MPSHLISSHAYVQQAVMPASAAYVLLFFNAVLSPGGLLTSFLSQHVIPSHAYMPAAGCAARQCSLRAALFQCCSLAWRAPHILPLATRRADVSDRGLQGRLCCHGICRHLCFATARGTSGCATVRGHGLWRGAVWYNGVQWEANGLFMLAVLLSSSMHPSLPTLASLPFSPLSHTLPHPPSPITPSLSTSPLPTRHSKMSRTVAIVSSLSHTCTCTLLLFTPPFPFHPIRLAVLHLSSKPFSSPGRCREFLRILKNSLAVLRLSSKPFSSPGPRNPLTFTHALFSYFPSPRTPSPPQAGSAALVFQALLLALAVGIFSSLSHCPPVLQQGLMLLFLLLVVLSRVGHWTFEIVDSQIIQTAIPPASANLIGTTEIALASLAELLMLGIAIVVHDPKHFAALAAMSMAAVFAAAGVYCSWLARPDPRIQKLFPNQPEVRWGEVFGRWGNGGGRK